MNTKPEQKPTETGNPECVHVLGYVKKYGAFYTEPEREWWAFSLANTPDGCVEFRFCPLCGAENKAPAQEPEEQPECFGNAKAQRAEHGDDKCDFCPHIKDCFEQSYPMPDLARRN